jgi:hypothetical protein
MEAWGFKYKSNLVWHKIRKDGGPDGRGVGFYFRNVTELVLFGVRGKNARTLAPGRRQVNFLATQKREHSRKPDEMYQIIESCSPGPYLELFARGTRPNWLAWGNEADNAYYPKWRTYVNHSQAELIFFEQARPRYLNRKYRSAITSRSIESGPIDLRYLIMSSILMRAVFDIFNIMVMKLTHFAHSKPELRKLLGTKKS